MKKAILIIIIILLPLTGCIEENPRPSDFYGTWIPCDETTIDYGYYFDSIGNVFKAIKIGDEIFYMRYCNWQLQHHILVLCGQRLNFKFEGNKLYLYDFQDTSTEKCYVKVI